MAVQLQQNAYGFSFTLTTNIDMTNTTNVTVYILPQVPGVSALITKNLTGSDIANRPTGVIAVPIVQGDLTHTGWHAIQAVDVTAGRRMYSTVGRFEVLENVGP